MKKITKLVAGLLLLTMLTGCELNGKTPENNNNPNQNENNNNGNGSGNYNGEGTNQNDGANNNETTPSGNDGQSGDPSLPTVTSSITVEELAEGYGWENAQKYSSFKMDSKITISSEGGDNTGKYYYSDETYRLYGAENAKLIFQAPEGQYIRGIKLTFKVKNNGAFREGLQSGTKKEFNSDKVTLNVSTGHILIQEFEVEYTGEKGDNPFVRDAWTEAELALLAERAYGIDVPYYFILGNQLNVYQESEDDEGILSLYGAEITVSEMAPYAQLFRAAENWEELSDPQM